MVALGVGQKNTASVNGRGANERGQGVLVDDGAIEKRPEVAHRRLLDDLYAKEAHVLERIDAYDDVGELGRQYVAVVVARVIRPDDLHAVVAQVTPLDTHTHTRIYI